MAENQNPNPNSGSSMHQELEDRFHWLRQEFLPRHGSKVLVLIVVIVAVVIGIMQYQNKTKVAEATFNSELGKSFSFLYQNHIDSAMVSLQALLAKPGVSGLAEAKAALLLGNLQFQKGELDGAEKSFERSQRAAHGVVLIQSAAEHGLATVSMEKKDYAQAVTRLESFVKTYGKRDGDLAAFMLKAGKWTKSLRSPMLYGNWLWFMWNSSRTIRPRPLLNIC
ncbi:MAG TPA: tetratricopeptide repeat protein [Fibrobacteraceae bacterium]|nr:tetratricopeptide repeat protein [Fibrobacteraceae bacterium]